MNWSLQIIFLQFYLYLLVMMPWTQEAPQAEATAQN